MRRTTSHYLYAVFLLRFSLGILFIAHALLKPLVFTFPGTAQFFESVGFPSLLVYPVFVVELVAGAMLVAGLYTRWAALAVLPVMIGASAVHWPNGWIFNNPNGGWEFPVFVGIACLVLFLLNEDGALALASRAATAPAGRPGRV